MQLLYVLLPLYLMATSIHEIRTCQTRTLPRIYGYAQHFDTRLQEATQSFPVNVRILILQYYLDMAVAAHLFDWNQHNIQKLLVHPQNIVTYKKEKWLNLYDSYANKTITADLSDANKKILCSCQLTNLYQSTSCSIHYLDFVVQKSTLLIGIGVRNLFGDIELVIYQIPYRHGQTKKYLGPFKPHFIAPSFKQKITLLCCSEDFRSIYYYGLSYKMNYCIYLFSIETNRHYELSCDLNSIQNKNRHITNACSLGNQKIIVVSRSRDWLHDQPPQLEIHIINCSENVATQSYITTIVSADLSNQLDYCIDIWKEDNSITLCMAMYNAKDQKYIPICYEFVATLNAMNYIMNNIRTILTTDTQYITESDSISLTSSSNLPSTIQHKKNNQLFKILETLRLLALHHGSCRQKISE